MAKEIFNPIPISDFHRGDKIVLRDSKYWLRGNGIWTVDYRASDGIYASCRANDGPHDKYFEKSDIMRKIEKKEQLQLFFFCYP